MPITGSWNNRQKVAAGARRWGTGINPVHTVRSNVGRDTAPGHSEPPPEEFTENTGYTQEDMVGNAVYGYGHNTGTADRPNWTQQDFRGDVPEDYPAWGEYTAGVPGGTGVRSINKGADLSYTERDPIDQSAVAGWVNKETTYVNDAEPSDPRQYVIQTSMTQLDGTREGSPTSGRASQYKAPMATRLTGMKLKVAGDATRHNAMEPRSQDYKVRSWWARNAGVGTNMRNVKVNEKLDVPPLTRNPPPDPYTGPAIGFGTDYGSWSDEDLGLY